LIAASQASAAAPSQPATQPAIVSVDAFPADAKLAPELAAKFKAKLVTLNVTNMPALQAMTELAKVSGYTIKPAYDNVFSNGNRRPGNITISAVDQPFWSVFRDICVQGNISIYNNGGESDRTIRIAPGNYNGPSGMRGTVSIKGPFMFVPTYLERENSIHMASPNKVNRNIYVQSQMYVEPSATIAEMSYDPIVDEATDDHGNSMASDKLANRPTNMQQSRGIGSYCRMSMRYPTTNPGSHITTIKGHIAAMVAGGGGGTLEAPDPLNAAETTKTVAGRSITFHSLKKEGSRYVLELVMHRGDGDTQQFYRSFNAPLVCHLTDAKDEEATSYMMGGSGNGDSITRRFGFDAGANPPTKLVVDVPGGLQQIDIPFELANLPLP